MVLRPARGYWREQAITLIDAGLPCRSLNECNGDISTTIRGVAGNCWINHAHLRVFASVGDNPSDFSVSWDGTNLLSLTNPNTGANWTQFTFQVTGTGSDTLQFSFRDDPAWMALDNVSVTQNSGQSVPEPSSFLLLGTGVIGLGGIVRRKLRR